MQETDFWGTLTEDESQSKIYDLLKTMYSMYSTTKQ